MNHIWTCVTCSNICIFCVQSNLSTTTTHGAQKYCRLLTGGRCLEVIYVGKVSNGTTKKVVVVDRWSLLGGGHCKCLFNFCFSYSLFYLRGPSLRYVLAFRETFKNLTFNNRLFSGSQLPRFQPFHVYSLNLVIYLLFYTTFQRFQGKWEGMIWGKAKYNCLIFEVTFRSWHWLSLGKWSVVIIIHFRLL